MATKRKKHWRLAPYFPFVDFRGGKRGLGEPTKQDFVAVAKIFCRRGASDGLVSDFSDYFASQNPRFDRSRFIGATKKC